MKCQILFSGKTKKNVENLSSVEFALRVVKATILQRECKNRTVVNSTEIFSKADIIPRDVCEIRSFTNGVKSGISKA